jgi:integrase
MPVSNEAPSIKRPKSTIIQFPVSEPTPANELQNDDDTLTPFDNITPSDSIEERKVYKKQAADAITDEASLIKISQYFLSKRKYRHNLMWVIALNTGMRFSDLVSLRFSDFVEPMPSENGETLYVAKKHFDFIQKKTQRKREIYHSNANTRVYINRAIREAIRLFMNNLSDADIKNGITPNSLIFASQSRDRAGLDKPLTNVGWNDILKAAAAQCGVDIKISAHTTRKTFMTFMFLKAAKMNLDPASEYALLLVSDLVQHSSLRQTARYVGVMREDQQKVAISLNLCLGAYKAIPWIKVGGYVEED